MRIKQAIIISMIALATTILAWRSVITIDAGRVHKLTIGMEDSASVGFDLKIDKPSPPPPPIGFYCFFSLSDSNYDFIDGLWGDIRPISDSASWEVILRRQEEEAVVAVDSLPREGSIYINEQKMDSSKTELIVPKGSGTIDIKFLQNVENPPDDLK